MKLPDIEIIEGKRAKFALYKNDDLIGKHLRDHGVFAEKEVTLAVSIAKSQPDSIILDVGANFGSFDVAVARTLSMINSGHMIHCFEPQSIVYFQLCTNIFLNRLTNVRPYNVAVGATEDTISLPILDFENSLNPGGFSYDPFTRENLERSSLKGGTARNLFTDQTEFVTQITIDSLALDKPISFIKLDVEGAELDCLFGSRRTIQDNGFPPIVFEDWGTKFDWHIDKSLRLRKYLTEDLGYQVSSIGGREMLAIHRDSFISRSLYS